MANGDNFTPDQLREHIKPIEAIRKDIENYAQSEGLDTTFHSKGWPDARLDWINKHEIHCTIELGMDQDMTSYILAIGAHKDVEGKRYIFMTHLEKDLKTPFDAVSILEKIKAAKVLCDSKRFEDLPLSKRDQKGTRGTV